MRTFSECYSCILQQVLTVMDLEGLEENERIPVLNKVLIGLAEAPQNITPPGLFGLANQILIENTGITDPYRESKDNSLRIALGYLEDLRKMVSEGGDPFLQGLKVSAAGNMIDVVHAREYHLWDDVQDAVNQDLQGPVVEDFRERLSRVPYLLYLADNAGEAVFDRVFIETLSVPVLYTVKGGPVVNDATREDALRAGIDQVAEIIDTGSAFPGTILPDCSREFVRKFREAPLILAKGQANYETLDDQPGEIFFLLRTKCPLIAREMGEQHGSLVLTRGVANPPEN